MESPFASGGAGYLEWSPFNHQEAISVLRAENSLPLAFAYLFCGFNPSP